jgi:bifunctional non-homologous end joining protein LigD
MAKKDHLTIEGRDVPVSNLDKVLYPENGFTKAQVIDYYIRVSQYLLPHFRNRPVTLKRYPDGVRGEFFYEKDAPRFTPKWVETFPVPRKTGGTDIRYILVNDLPTLVWCANIASLELHPFLHQAPEIDRPTSVVFDLDPGTGMDILACAQVGFLLRDLFQRLDMQSFAKVSGSKGIQVYVPLNGATSYAVTQPFALAIAQLLSKEHPDLIVSEMAKVQRVKKVFIDWSQNADFKTTVGVYSLRAKRGRPYVSLPITWDELRRALDSKDANALLFEPEAALKRLEETGDLFAPVLSLQQSLPESVMADAAPAANLKRKRSASLKEYEKKRDFSKTAEPQASVPRPSKQGSRRRFVVQKHAASHLHYDFRLEMHGVLKSWAVPKGVPYALNDRRLAMATEDHPLEYLDFEGTIPKGQYGGGTVMVWDIGTYELIEGNYYKGNLQIHLEGTKLKGEWTLRKDRDNNKNWYLAKSGANAKPLSKKRENESALTQRTLEQIAAANDAQWHSNRSEIQGIDLDALPQSELEFIEPMQCRIVDSLPEGEDWEYELKLDGYRALGIKQGGKVRLLSRRNNMLNDRFPGIVDALSGLEDGLIVDGEIVALDSEGRPSFNTLQNDRNTKQPILFYLFDVLAYRARSLLAIPLRQRREVLRAVLAEAPDGLRISDPLSASAAALVDAVREHGLEGVIAKRRDSKYEPGVRGDNWVKYRVSRGQELVIGGYKPGGKNHFENLAVGYYDRGKLLFAGKVKNGFTPAIKDDLFQRFGKLETTACPFRNLPEPKNARRGEALTEEVMKKYRWLRPKLVAHIDFVEWTAAGHLRHSKFVALRDDKRPKDVTREST